MDNGWIKVFRSLPAWRWYKHSNTKDLYLHLLMKSCIVDTPFLNFILKPGQYVSTVRELGFDLGISEKAIRVAIKNLLESDDIAIKTTNKFTIFTVQNWDKYQNIPEQQGNQKGNQKGNQTANEKEFFCAEKNDFSQFGADNGANKMASNGANIEKKDKNINIPTPGVRVREGLSEEENELFEKFLDMWSWQHGKGKKMSPYAEEGQLLNLLRLPQETRVKALTRAITESWKNIHDIRRDARGRFIKEEKSFDVNDPSTWDS